MLPAMRAVLPEHRFRALADPTRLRLLALLRQEEICVGDLVAALDLPQGTVSRHLATLRRVGLVESRRDGCWVYYRRTEICDAVRPLGLAVEEAVAELPEVATDQRRLERYRSQHGGCC